MCTETFLRLPEEKRGRFLEAAWEEFTRVKFADASINQIVRHAGIPRGSFYQYFTDKEDLFEYLLRGVRDRFVGMFSQFLEEAGGDVFHMQLMSYDRACSDTETSLIRDRFLCILQKNPGMDLERIIMGDYEEMLCRPIWDRLDLSGFRSTDRDSVRYVLCLTSFIMIHAVMDCLAHPERRAEYRRGLEAQLDIIKYGCLGKPQAAPADT